MLIPRGFTRRASRRDVSARTCGRSGRWSTRRWAAGLRDELGWLAGILGTVRDGDVLLERMRRRATELPEANSRGAARVLASLEGVRGEAHAELLATLRGEHYLTLLDRLVAAANAPALLLEADLPAPAVLAGLVRPGGRWRRA